MMKTQCCNSYYIKDSQNNLYCSYCLKHNPKPVKGKNWTLIAIFFLLMLGIYSFCKAPDISNFIHFNTFIQDSCDIDLNDSCIIRELIAQDFQFPSVALAKIKMESGAKYNSRVCLEQHNLFGYGWNGKTYHTYKTYRESIKAYKKWETRYLKEHSKRYAENKQYSTILSQIKEK
jgi:hypothetical protein